MKKVRIAAIVLTAVLIVCITAALIIQNNYLIIDGKMYARDLTALDLSGQNVPDPQALSSLSALEQLDLRDTGLTVEAYEQLQAALPNCDIQWLLPFQDRLLPLDTQVLTLSRLTAQDIALLAYLPDLKIVDAADCTDYDLIVELTQQYPDLDVRYRLSLGASSLDQDAVHFSSANLEHITLALRYLPKLETVDAAGCTDFDGIQALQSQYPNCHFSYQVPFCGTFWQEDTTSMAVNATSGTALAQVLPYLPDVTSVTITEPIEDPLEMVAVVQTYPQIAFTYSFPLFDTIVGNNDTFLDISDTVLDHVSQLEAYLPLFTNLEKVDMCRCGIANEDMAALNDRHPDTLFVWEVQMGHFTLRTDIIFFMPYQYRYQLTDADADLLKYFTELICIDFGHMNISRTDYLAYMPKLQFLLMCDTRITDISYCANMKDLKYVELFMSDVTDFSPLLQCKNLEDLNICYTYPEDPMIFAQMPQLKNLWFRGDLDYSIRDALRAALPNTRMLFGPGSSTGRGWRRLPNYYAQRDLMGMPYMDEP